MSLKWRQFKYELKAKRYDDSKTKEEMIAYIPNPRVDPSQYRDLVHYWCSEKGQEISNTNKRNRSKYEDLHCMGTKNLPRRIHEMILQMVLLVKITKLQMISTRGLLKFNN
ncbi:hypothetical protein GmHk_01G001133 [Glycine max]|nr:hypothetical protein GmHk_01G001133 [Glycine max]